ncbi:MAG TPA: hypothetical protein VFU59_08325 [Candidatus Eisenbacteria bacterium]|nr:hypothetical protein [Candidatus Eisenbacteria bacterium]
MNRIRWNVWLAAALLIALGAGCGARTESAAPAPKGEAAVATPAADAGHADGSHAEGIVPGSYADWCAEHGVPETACTRCDASLIAAFKATGDWCEDHGVPKSQCTTCDPTLKIVRPPAPEGVQ